MRSGRLVSAVIVVVAVLGATTLQATAADADAPAVDVSVSVAATHPIVGGHALWHVTTTNNGTLPAVEAEVVTLTYNLGGNPSVPDQDHAYSDITVISPNADRCVVTTSIFVVTCSFPPLTPAASETFTVRAKTNLRPAHQATINWDATASAPAGDENTANNTETSGTTTFSRPDPRMGPLAASSNRLVAGETLTSPNGQYALKVSPEGNVVESGNGRTFWQSHTDGNPGAYLQLGAYDGSLAVMDGNDQSVWSANTSRTAVSYPSFEITNDGNLVDRDPDGILWQKLALGTDGLTAPARLSAGQYIHAGKARLLLKPDGNLVDYVGNKVVWSSHTASHQGAILRLGTSGNLVLRSASGKVLWSSHTSGSGRGNRLTIRPHGLLKLTHGSKVVWHAR